MYRRTVFFDTSQIRVMALIDLPSECNRIICFNLLIIIVFAAILFKSRVKDLKFEHELFRGSVSAGMADKQGVSLPQNRGSISSGMGGQFAPDYTNGFHL